MAPPLIVVPVDHIEVYWDGRPSRDAFINNLHSHVGHEVKIRGWIFRIRELAKTTFVLVKDCTGIVQCVGATDVLRGISPTTR